MSSSTLVIARREFRSNFDSPIGYVVIIISLFIVGAFVFRDYWTLNRATLSPLFTYLPFAFYALIIPAITMRLFAEEKRTGTIELLITMPVRDRDVVIGKFLGTMGVVCVLLILTATYPILISRIGNLDWNPTWVGYFGLLLGTAAGVSIGLFFSSITENQIVAFFLTAFVVFIGLFLIEYLGAAVGGTLGDVIAFVSFMRRLQPFQRGLLDLRNVVYFLSVTVFFLLLTTRSLESRKWK
jgi:ABC-2 type transport system permease protein